MQTSPPCANGRPGAAGTVESQCFQSIQLISLRLPVGFTMGAHENKGVGLKVSPPSILPSDLYAILPPAAAANLGLGREGMGGLANKAFPRLETRERLRAGF